MMSFDLVKDQIFSNIIHIEVPLNKLFQCFIRFHLSIFTRLKVMQSILLTEWYKE